MRVYSLINQLIMKTFKSQLFFASAALMALCGTTSCNIRNFAGGMAPSSESTNRTYQTGQFRAVVNRTVADVDISRAEECALSIEAPTNYLKYIDVKVDGGVLYIGQKKDVHFSEPDRIEVSIGMPSLERVSADGTGDMDISGAFEADIFEARSAGTGDIDIASVQANDLTIASSGTGDISFTGNVSGQVTATSNGTGEIELKGTCETAEYSTSGTGDIDASEMRASGVKASSSGTGDISCYAAKSFSGSASGTGDITVYGKPATRQAASRNISFE